MGTQAKFSAEFRERAVSMLLEQQHEHGSQWAAMDSIAAKIGCTAETLRKWVRRAEVGWLPDLHPPSESTRAGP